MTPKVILPSLEPILKAGSGSGSHAHADAHSDSVLFFRSPKRRWGQMLSQGLRLVVGGGLLVLAGGWVWQKQQVVETHKGYINGTILPINAPIAGELQLVGLRPGVPVRSGQVVGRVSDRRSAGTQWEGQKQQLQTQVRLTQSQMALLREKQGRRRAMVQQFERDAGAQKGLLAGYDQQRVERSLGEVRKAEEMVAVARREADRLQGLAKAGVIPQIQAQQAADAVRTAQLEVESRAAQVKQVEMEERANQKGVQLDGARTMSYAEQRIRELETEIGDLDQELVGLQVKLETLQREMGSLKTQQTLQTVASVQSPTTGVVWSVDHRSGQGVRPVAENTTLMQVLNCSDTWVEAFVGERELRYLKVGDRAKVQVLGMPDTQMVGRIRSIRAGMGRVQLGDVAVPPADEVRQEVAVQIELPRPLTAQTPSAQFCGVGQSTEVTFQKPKQKEPGMMATLRSMWQN